MTRRRILVVLIVVVGVALAIQFAVSRIDVATQRALVESRLSAAFGLEVTIAGDFELSAFPRPHLRVSELRVANVPGSPSPQLLEVAELSFGFGLLPLFSGLIELDRVKLNGATLHLEPDATGRIEAGAQLQGLTELDEPEGDAPLRVELEAVEVEDVRVFYRDPKSGEVHAGIVESLLVESSEPDQPLEVQARGSIEGGSFDLSGRLGPLAQLLEGKTPYPLRIAGRVFEARVQLDGQIANPRAFTGVDVTIDAALPELSQLAASWTDALPDLGPGSFHARVHDTGGKLGLDALRLAPQGGPVRGSLTGAVRDLREFRGVDLQLSADADDLSRLGPLDGRTAPAGSHGRLRATLSDRDRPLSLDADLVLRTADGSIVVQAKGGYEDLSATQGVEFALQLDARDLAGVGAVLGLETALPAIGPVEAKGTLHSRSGALGLDDIRIEIGDPKDVHGSGSGSIERLADLSGLRLTSRVTAADASRLGRYLGRELPKIGGIRADIAFSDADGSLGIESIEIHTGDGAVSVDLSGSFDDLRARDEIEITAKLRARDLAAVGRLFDVALPPVGPVEFAGRVTSSEHELTSEGRVRLNRTEFRGNWLARLGGARPYVEATLESPHVYLDDLGVEPNADIAAVRSRAAQRARDSALLDQLRAVDLRVALSLARVSGRAGFDVQNMTLAAVLDHGELNAHLTQAKELLVASLRLDARGSEPTLELDARANGIDLAKLALQLEADAQSAGSLEATIDLNGRGASWERMQRQLSGRIWLRLHDWAVAGRYSREFIRSLSVAFLPSLRPPPVQKFGCFVADARVAGGVARFDELILEGEGVVVTGTGSLDLVRETLDLRLVPTVSDPALLSIAPTVDVSGPLRDPQFKAVRRTFATSAAQALIGRALKPASALLRPLTGGPAPEREACTAPPPSVAIRGLDYLKSITGSTLEFFTP